MQQTRLPTFLRPIIALLLVGCGIGLIVVTGPGWVSVFNQSAAIRSASEAVGGLTLLMVAGLLVAKIFMKRIEKLEGPYEA